MTVAQKSPELIVSSSSIDCSPPSVLTPCSGSLYLSKIAGGSITEDEARQVLAGYGDLERLWYCSQTDKEMFRLAEGIWVMFAYFQDCRDAQTVSTRGMVSLI